MEALHGPPAQAQPAPAPADASAAAPSGAKRSRAEAAPERPREPQPQAAEVRRKPPAQRTAEEVEHDTLAARLWFAQVALLALERREAVLAEARSSYERLLSECAALCAAAKAKGTHEKPTVCGDTCCLYVGFPAAVAAHERGKHGDELGLLAARRSGRAGVANTGRSCSVSAVFAALAFVNGAVPLTPWPPSVVKATESAKPADAAALITELGIEMPAAPAVVLEAALDIWPAALAAAKPRRFLDCTRCAATVGPNGARESAGEFEDPAVLYVRRANGEEKPVTKENLVQAIAVSDGLLVCKACSGPARAGVRPGGVLVFETPFGATPAREILAADGAAYNLAAVVSEVSPGHAAAHLFLPSGKIALLDDGAFVPDVPAPPAATLRLMFFVRAQAVVNPAAAPAAQPPLSQFRVRKPLGAPTFSWAYVALLAAAAGRPGHDSARAVETVGVQLFAAAAAELVGFLPPDAAWTTHGGAPYAPAPAQQAAIDAAILAAPAGPTAHCNELFARAPARPALRLVDPLPVQPGDLVAGDSRGDVFEVVALAAGFASLRLRGAVFERIPVAALSVVQASRLHRPRRAAANVSFVEFAAAAERQHKRRDRRGAQRRRRRRRRRRWRRGRLRRRGARRGRRSRRRTGAASSEAATRGLHLRAGCGPPGSPRGLLCTKPPRNSRRDGLRCSRRPWAPARLRRRGAAATAGRARPATRRVGARTLVRSRRACRPDRSYDPRRCGAICVRRPRFDNRRRRRGARR